MVENGGGVGQHGKDAMRSMKKGRADRVFV
jgi:hypothetical protein